MERFICDAINKWKRKRRGQFIARGMRKKGLELTPEECVVSVEKTYGKIRAAMVERGIEPPETNAELRDLIRQSGALGDIQ